MAVKRALANRPVDRAMVAERAPKTTVRSLWVDKVRELHGTSDHSVPLYLTLPGAEATDIGLLIQDGILKLTEVGSIDESSKGRVVAIESSALAVAHLQAKLPGLKILETNVQGLVRGTGLLSFPDGAHEEACRARIVNLDLNARLADDQADGALSFPIITWIQKFSRLHAKAPRIDWTLLLTLHGEFGWSAACARDVRTFLAQNFVRDAQFSAQCQRLLGDALHTAIAGGSDTAFTDLPRDQQQKVLMVFVPKKLAHLGTIDGWKVQTAHNLRYGRNGEAPMVTWVINFVEDRRAHITPEAVYLESLRDVLATAGHIEDDGKLSALDLS